MAENDHLPLTWHIALTTVYALTCYTVIVVSFIMSSSKACKFNNISIKIKHFRSQILIIRYHGNVRHVMLDLTRSSADADNGLDALSGQSRSTNMVPFHMLHIVSYCAIVTLSSRRAVFTIFDFKKCRDLEMGVTGHSRSLRVVSFDRLCMVSY